MKPLQASGPEASSRTVDPVSEAPLVTVCIPTYKGAAYLGETIASVLSQSHAHLEVWVVDDRSPDETQAVVAAFKDPRLHYVRNDANLGPEGNWNKCLGLARGKYYKLLPHDDLLAPEAIAQQVEVLEGDADQSIALVFGYRQIIDAHGQLMAVRRPLGRTRRRWRSASLVRRCVRSGTNPLGEPGNGLIRTALISRIGAYDAGAAYMVDLDYWFRALMHGDAVYTASHSSSFRVSGGAWSVVIGSKQVDDFARFVEKFRRHQPFGLTSLDVGIGRFWAGIYMRLRRIVYMFIR